MIASKYRVLAIEYWLPLLLWLGAIHFFSTDVLSSSETSRFIGPLLKYFFPNWPLAEIEFWHGVFRKCGHVAEYFVLTALTYRCIIQNHPNPTNAKVVTILILLATACIDEFHQSLTMTRLGSLIDVGYDGIGGVSALWLAYATEGRYQTQSCYESRRLHSHPIL